MTNQSLFLIHWFSELLSPLLSKGFSLSNCKGQFWDYLVFHEWVRRRKFEAFALLDNPRNFLTGALLLFGISTPYHWEWYLACWVGLRPLMATSDCVLWWLQGLLWLMKQVTILCVTVCCWKVEGSVFPVFWNSSERLPLPLLPKYNTLYDGGGHRFISYVMEVFPHHCTCVTYLRLFLSIQFSTGLVLWADNFCLVELFFFFPCLFFVVRKWSE